MIGLGNGSKSDRPTDCIVHGCVKGIIARDVYTIKTARTSGLSASMQHMQPLSWDISAVFSTWLRIRQTASNLILDLVFRRVRKIAKATISFVMSVGPSVRMEQLGSQ
jgi:hypothetical protein